MYLMMSRLSRCRHISRFDVVVGMGGCRMRGVHHYAYGDPSKKESPWRDDFERLLVQVLIIKVLKAALRVVLMARRI